MFTPTVKRGTFVLEGVNAFATSLYFNYLFFHMHDRFGFTNRENLALCALNGLVYCVAVWLGGKFAQRRGYFVALRLGFATMAVALGLGSIAGSVVTQAACMVLWTLGMSLTWPTLEAIVSEREPPERLRHRLGLYNVVWATCSGLANFTGGVLLEKLGRTGTFLVPAMIHVGQLVLTQWLATQAREAAVGPETRLATTASPGVQGAVLASEAERRRSAIPPDRFLKLAWIANPFAYIAMNALVPIIPKLAERFALSPMLAGFVCSAWFFARAAGFLGLWIWTGWHYRFGWLVAAFVAMAVTFLAIVLAPSLWLLLVAQIVFGAAVGLIYYSSLFYSMDVGDTKGEHGGFHEAALGAGIFAGPAVGSLSLRYFPDQPNMNAWAVAVMLTAGLAWLIAVRYARSPAVGHGAHADCRIDLERNK
jgi:predicted MFS family arabinose efflux permease